MDPELEKILKELAGELGSVNDMANRLRNTIGDGLPNWDRANSELNMFARNTNSASSQTRNLGNQQKDAADKTKKFSTYVTNSFSKFNSAVSASGAENLKSIIDSFGGAVTDMVDRIPIIGSVLGGFTAALTGATSIAFGFADQITDTNKKLYEAGAVFEDFGIRQGSGIDEFTEIVGAIGISGGTLVNALEQASDSFKILGGGTAGGIRKVTEAFGKLQKAQNGELDQLYRLGFTTEDVLAGMADYAAAARLSGKNLNTDELAASTQRYLNFQRELTRITGQDVKSRKAKEEALRTEIAFQEFIKQLGKDGPEMAAAIADVPDELRATVQRLIMGTELTTQEMALLAQNMGQPAVDAFKQMGQEALKEGQLPEGFITKELQKGLKLSLDNFDRLAGGIGFEQLSILTDANNAYSDMLKAIGLIRNALNPVASSIEQDTANVNKAMTDQAGEIGKGIASVEKTAVEVQALLYSSGVGMTKVFGEVSRGLLAAVGASADQMQKFVNVTGDVAGEIQTMMAATVGEGKEYESQEAKDTAIKNLLTEKFGETVGGTIGDFFEGTGAGNGIFGATFNELMERLQTGIISAINDGFDQVLESTVPGYMGKSQAREELDEKLPELIEKISKVQEGEQIVPDVRLDRIIQALGQEAIDKLSSKGIKAESYDPLGPFSSETFTLTKKPPAQAFGNIMEPKPGGHIVKVAEAGQPEVIAPASRGPDGKLGLEVSGVMLDNSRLLQSLLRVNEGQAALMAGLNDKISNMSGHMENLVSAQRQANRLAV